jgi:hypothetical protein
MSVPNPARPKSPRRRWATVNHRCATNPRFIETLLDELIVFPAHQGLHDRLHECLSARPLENLDTITLWRIEAELVAELIRSAITLRTGATVGMTEAELAAALSGKHAEVSALRAQLSYKR